MPTLAAKVAFLGSAAAYCEVPKRLTCLETHMSWVFLVDDAVYKLKKPVRFAYLDFSTLEAGRMEMDPVDFSPHSLVEDTCNFMSLHGHQKGLEFNCFVSPETPSWLRGDAGRVCKPWRADRLRTSQPATIRRGGGATK